MKRVLFFIALVMFVSCEEDSNSKPSHYFPFKYECYLATIEEYDREYVRDENGYLLSLVDNAGLDNEWKNDFTHDEYGNILTKIVYVGGVIYSESSYKYFDDRVVETFKIDDNVDIYVEEGDETIGNFSNVYYINENKLFSRVEYADGEYYSSTRYFYDNKNDLLRSESKRFYIVGDNEFIDLDDFNGDGGRDTTEYLKIEEYEDYDSSPSIYMLRLKSGIPVYPMLHNPTKKTTTFHTNGEVTRTEIITYEYEYNDMGYVIKRIASSDDSDEDSVVLAELNYTYQCYND